MAKIFIDIEIKSKIWQNIHNIKPFIKKRVNFLLHQTELKSFLKKPNNYLELMISLVSDNQIRTINHQFRNKNKATDILSFPFLDENLIKEKGLEKTINNKSDLILGDIILSLETTRKEAAQNNKKLLDHISHLLLHSILHLIGYNHENDSEAKKMEELEIKILKKLNISNPYQC